MVEHCETTHSLRNKLREYLDQNQREKKIKKKFRQMVKEERNLVDERTQQVTRLESEVEELKNKIRQQEDFNGESVFNSIMKLLEEKTQQVSKLELEVKEKDGQLKELNVEHRALKIILKKKDQEIFQMTNEQVKREIEDENIVEN